MNKIIRKVREANELGKAVGPLIIVAWLGTGTYQRMTEPKCEEIWSVLEVGGCDFLGKCGVLLKNGEKITAMKPIVGEKICIREIGYFDWFLKWRRLDSQKIDGAKVSLRQTLIVGDEAIAKAKILIDELAKKWNASPEDLQTLFAKLERAELQKYLKSSDPKFHVTQEQIRNEAKKALIDFCSKRSLPESEVVSSFSNYQKVNSGRYLRVTPKR